MPGLREIANQYHHAANRIAARADRTGVLTDNQRIAINGYRGAAAKIEALIRPEDSLPKEAIEVKATFSHSVSTVNKVSARDKAATPQELLEKANG